MADVLDWLETPDQSITIVLSPGEDDLDRDERFERACRMFPEMKIEMDEAGNIIMTPGNSDDSSFRSGEAYASPLRNELSSLFPGVMMMLPASSISIFISGNIRQALSNRSSRSRSSSPGLRTIVID